MGASVDAIKELRDMTSCGVIECKKALEETDGDFEKAKELLRKRGLELAAKKGNREAKQGRVEAYVHLGSKIGVLVEVNAETDFVAQNSDFCKFAKDVAMHIAAMAPQYIRREDVPEAALAGYPDKEVFFKEKCLMEQPFVKDPKLTIQDYLNSLVAKIGENMFVGRFKRFKVGDVE